MREKNETFLSEQEEQDIKANELEKRKVLEEAKKVNPNSIYTFFNVRHEDDPEQEIVVVWNNAEFIFKAEYGKWQLDSLKFDDEIKKATKYEGYDEETPLGFFDFVDYCQELFIEITQNS